MYKHNVELQRLRKNCRSRTGNGVHSKSLKRGRSERKDQCLDCDNGEVVSWSMNSDIVPTAPTFDDFLLDEIENAIDNM